TYGGDKLGEYYEAIIADEVNVKEVKYVNEVKLAVTVDKNITPELQREGMMREVIRGVQNARKQAGLNVDDRIVLQLSTADDELATAVDEHAQTIQAETLAQTFANPGSDSYAVVVSIDSRELTIELKKTQGLK
ncbi:MAG: DUF5915 domain-containing protein, partial [Candidatus Saccharimonadales bacterium]